MTGGDLMGLGWRMGSRRRMATCVAQERGGQWDKKSSAADGFLIHQQWHGSLRLVTLSVASQALEQAEVTAVACGREFSLFLSADGSFVSH